MKPSSLLLPLSLKAPCPAFAGQVWRWLAFQDSASGEEGNDITVADPAKYTLELLADGTYTIQADCNSGSGHTHWMAAA